MVGLTGFHWNLLLEQLREWYSVFNQAGSDTIIGTTSFA